MSQALGLSALKPASTGHTRKPGPLPPSEHDRDSKCDSSSLEKSAKSYVISLKNLDGIFPEENENAAP